MSESLNLYGDAKVITPFFESNPVLAQKMVISLGANKESQKWKPATMPIGAFMAKLARHEVGNKDGPGYVLGDMVPGRRFKTAIKRLDAVGLDVDVGTSTDQIDAALKKLGRMAIRYSTHSHLKSTTEFKRDRLTKWAEKEANGDNFEQDEVLHRFLLEQEKWDPAIIETAHYVRDDHQDRGIMAIVEHRAMPKHRIVLPFAKPFVISEQSGTQADAIKRWGKVPTAVARVLGVPLDESCLDPSRLFYFPRHAKGRPFDASIFGGPLFDWTSLVMEDPFEAEIAKLTKGKSKSQTNEGRDLGRWSIKRAHGFQIVQALEDNCPEHLRNQTAQGWEITCPFDDEHSNPGTPDDRACMAVNPGDGPSDWFSVRCLHETCKSKTNLDMVGKMVADGWFARDVLDDETYNAVVEPVADLPALTPESSTQDVEAAVHVALDRALGEIEAERALEAIREAVKLAKRPFGKIVRRARGTMAIAGSSIDAGEKLPEDRVRALLIAYPPPPTSDRVSYDYRQHAGRVWLYADHGGDQGPKRLWTPWTIDAGVVEVDDGGKQGVRVLALDQDGQPRSFTVTAAEAFAGMGVPFKTRLREAGVGLTESGEAQAVRWLREDAPSKPIRVYQRPGWRAPGLFITPWGSASSDDEVELALGAMPTGAEFIGNLAGWKAATAAAWETDVLPFKIAPLVAFGAVLTDLCGVDSTWIALTGSTNKGKTTAARLMAAVWGDPDPRKGLYGPLNGTAGAAEARLAQGSGAGYAFDETNLVAGDQLQTLIFTGSGGAVRDRLTRSAELRSARTWRGMFMITGEHDLSRKIRDAGAAATTGVGTRVLELDCEDVPDLTRSEMDAIEGAWRNYGQAGVVFVRYLLDAGVADDPDALWSEIEVRARRLTGPDTTAATIRAARIAATLWRAGEIARDAGLLPLGADVESVARLAWATAQQSDLAPHSVEDGALRTLAEFLIRNRGGRVAEGLGEARVEATAWRLTPGDYMTKNWPWESHDAQSGVYVVPRQLLTTIVHGQLNPNALVKALAKRGALIPACEGRATWQHVPGLGRLSAVVLKASAVEDAVGAGGHGVDEEAGASIVKAEVLEAARQRRAYA